MASNVIFQVSPFPQVLKFDQAGDTGEADAAPFISILYGGCQWCFYGFFAFAVTKKSGFLVLVYSNVVGAFLGFYYVWGFQRNCRNKNSLRKLNKYLQAAGTAAGLQFVAMLFLPKSKALFLCGLASCVCSVVGACSLLATLPKVLETKCSASINLPLVVVGLASSVLWLVCGLMLWDAWITIPNISSFTISCVSLWLVHHYPRDPDQCAVPQSALGTSAVDNVSAIDAEIVGAALSGAAGPTGAGDGGGGGEAGRLLARSAEVAQGHEEEDGSIAEEAPLLRRTGSGSFFQSLAAASAAAAANIGRGRGERPVAAMAAAARHYGAVAHSARSAALVEDTSEAGEASPLAGEWTSPSPEPEVKKHEGLPEGETGGTW